MAMKAMRCTQCGAELELDDSREFGFCSSCGTKIMLQETVQHKHSGAVQMKIDNSDQGYNRIRLGNRAFEAGNYAEAYDYFTRGLEDVPDDFTAIYRKGICAVYLGTPTNLRIPELAACLKDADEEWFDMLDAHEAAQEKDPEEEAYLSRLAGTEEDDLICLVDHFADICGEYYYQLSSKEKCYDQALRWCELAKLYHAAYIGILAPEVKEMYLETAIKFCDGALKNKVSYYSHTTTNKKGVSTDHYANYDLDSASERTIKEIRAELAEKYNNLPARLAQAQELSDALGTLAEDTEKLAAKKDEAQKKYDAARKKFWSENLVLAAERDKKKNLTWIAVGVGLIFFIVTFFLRENGAIWPIAGAAVFILSFFVRSKLAKSSLAKMEKKHFPAELKALGKELDDARHEWLAKESERRNKQSEVDAFAATKK